MTDKVIYMDNAATSFPKPEQVYKSMDHFARNVGGSGGRSGHSKSIEASRVFDDTRESIAKLLGAKVPECVCFTSNATESLNQAIYGLFRPGHRIVTTSMEHNSVLRPLTDLCNRFGCETVIVEAEPNGICDLDKLNEALTDGTDFAVITFASNVTGSIQDIAAIGNICKQRNIPLVVDGAQGAGGHPIDTTELGIGFLAFTGHKSLFGPQGTGGFLIDPDLVERITPIIRGGTGSKSESMLQPDVLPDKFESGTGNGHGLAGLKAGVEYLLERGVEDVRNHEMKLWKQFREGLTDISHVRVYGPDDPDRSMAIVAVTVDGMEPTDVGFLLDVRHDIQVRPGLDCAPLAHKTIGTFPTGTIRFSLGFANTEKDVETALRALATIHDK